MKKIFTTLAAITASVFLGNASIAAGKPMLMPQVPASPVVASASSTSSACAPYTNYPTCISVTNLSRYPADVHVPSLGLEFYVNPGYAQPIVAPQYYPGLNVMVPNFYGNQVYYVPNRGDFQIPPFSKKIK